MFVYSLAAMVVNKVRLVNVFGCLGCYAIVVLEMVMMGIALQIQVQ